MTVEALLEPETYDLSADWGEVCELTVYYRDVWDTAPWAKPECEYCVAASGELRIGNWITTVDRAGLIKIAGPDRIKRLEEDRAEQLNREAAA